MKFLDGVMRISDEVVAWRRHAATMSPATAALTPQAAVDDQATVETTAEGKVDYRLTDYALGQETEFRRAGKVLSQ